MIRKNIDTKRFLFIFFISLVVIYGLFRASNYIFGPKLTIYEPIDGQKITSETFILRGNVKNSKEIYINDRSIYIDQEGNFVEEMISHSPYTVVSIFAKDRYNQSVNKIIKIAH